MTWCPDLNTGKYGYEEEVVMYDWIRRLGGERGGEGGRYGDRGVGKGGRVILGGGLREEERREEESRGWGVWADEVGGGGG